MIAASFIGHLHLEWIAARIRLRESKREDFVAPGCRRQITALLIIVSPSDDLVFADRHVTREKGPHAGAFTEGGYCTLFSEGMRLAGRGGADDGIAQACAAVYDDEFEHMLGGIAGFRRLELGRQGWGLLRALTVEQSRQRVRMRQAQFDHPVPGARLEELVAVGAQPVAFDWARAGLR